MHARKPEDPSKDPAHFKEFCGPPAKPSRESNLGLGESPLFGFADHCRLGKEPSSGSFTCFKNSGFRIHKPAAPSEASRPRSPDPPQKPERLIVATQLGESLSDSICRIVHRSQTKSVWESLIGAPGAQLGQAFSTKPPSGLAARKSSSPSRSSEVHKMSFSQYPTMHSSIKKCPSLCDQSQPLASCVAGLQMLRKRNHNLNVKLFKKGRYLQTSHAKVISLWAEVAADKKNLEK